MVYMLKLLFSVACVFCFIMTLVFLFLYNFKEDNFEALFCKIPATDELNNNGQFNTDTNQRYDNTTGTFLTSEQLQSLRILGVDTSALPAQFTEEQIICLETNLGSNRLEALTNGSLPIASDIEKAGSCL